MNVRKSLLSVVAALSALLGACAERDGARSDAPSGREASAGAGLSVIGSVSPVYGHTVRQGDVQRIAFALKDGARADSVVLSIGERRIAALDTAGYEYAVAKDHPAGRLIYRLTAYLDGRSESRTGEFTVLAAEAQIGRAHV